MHDIEMLANRVEKLETQNKWMKRGGAFALVLASTFVLMGEAPSGVIEAKRFVVKDDQGNTRAFMDAAQGHGRIWLTDEGGKNRVFLGASKTAPGLQINNEADKARVKVLDESSGAYISLHDSSGKEIFRKP